MHRKNVNGLTKMLKKTFHGQKIKDMTEDMMLTTCLPTLETDMFQSYPLLWASLALSSGEEEDAEVYFLVWDVTPSQFRKLAICRWLDVYVYRCFDTSICDRMPVHYVKFVFDFVVRAKLCFPHWLILLVLKTTREQELSYIDTFILQEPLHAPCLSRTVFHYELLIKIFQFDVRILLTYHVDQLVL